MSRLFGKLHRDMNLVNVFAIHRCINEGYGLIQIFTEKIRISPMKLWRVCCRDPVYSVCLHYTVTLTSYTLWKAAAFVTVSQANYSK